MKAMRTFSLAIALVALAPFSSSAQDVIVTVSSPAEAKLAALDEGTPALDRRKFPPYAQLLDVLDRVCKENRTQIGTLVTRSVTALWKQDINISHLRFLQSMKASVAEGAPAASVSCADLAARVAAGSRQ